MRPKRNMYQFTRQIAKENELYPTNERKGWSSDDPEIIKSMILAELRAIRKQERPHLTVVEKS